MFFPKIACSALFFSLSFLGFSTTKESSIERQNSLKQQILAFYGQDPELKTIMKNENHLSRDRRLKQLNKFWDDFESDPGDSRFDSLKELASHRDKHMNEGYQTLSNSSESRYLGSLLSWANHQLKLIKQSHLEEDFDYRLFSDVRVLTCESFIRSLNLPDTKKQKYLNWYSNPDADYSNQILDLFKSKVKIQQESHLQNFIEEWLCSSTTNIYRRGLMLSKIALLESQKNIFDFLKNATLFFLKQEGMFPPLFSELSILLGQKNVYDDKRAAITLSTETLISNELNDRAPVLLLGKFNQLVKQYKEEIAFHDSANGWFFLSAKSAMDHELGHFLNCWIGRFEEYMQENPPSLREFAQGDILGILFDLEKRKTSLKTLSPLIRR